MTKFLFVNRFYSPDRSATAQIMSDLCEYLVSNGCDVEVICSRLRFDDPAARLRPRDCVQGVRIVRVATTRFGRRVVIGRLCDYLSFYVMTFFVLLCRLKRDDVVIAMTDPPLISVACAISAAVKRARLANWLQDLYPEVAVSMDVLSEGFFERKMMQVRDWSLRRAVLNIAIGERMAERLRARVPGADVTVVQNWSDDRQIRPIAHQDNALRRGWDFADDDVVIGYSGNLGRAHEIDTFLDAARQLEDRHDIRFLFIGAGYLFPRLKQRVAEARLTNIIFKPYQPRDQLSLALGVADVHWLSLLPAFEGLIVPSKFFGIAAAGRPVIAVVDQEGELGRIVSRHSCGCVVVPGDGTGFAQAIRKLADDREHRLALGRNARAMLESGFQQSQALDVLKQALRTLAPGGLSNGTPSATSAPQIVDAESQK